MRVLSHQEIQAVSGGAPAAPTGKDPLQTLYYAFVYSLVGLYLLVTGKSLTDLI